jgi:hypothetical protein
MAIHDDDRARGAELGESALDSDLGGIETRPEYIPRMHHLDVFLHISCARAIACPVLDLDDVLSGKRANTVYCAGLSMDAFLYPAR